MATQVSETKKPATSRVEQNPLKSSIKQEREREREKRRERGREGRIPVPNGGVCHLPARGLPLLLLARARAHKKKSAVFGLVLFCFAFI